jgi:hypothetical protein
LVNNGDGKFRVVSLQVVCKHGEQADIAELDLPRLGKNFMKHAACIVHLPVKLAN